MFFNSDSALKYIKNIKYNYYIVKLNKNHNLTNFSCGLEDLDQFLKYDALNQQEDKLNVT